MTNNSKRLMLAIDSPLLAFSDERSVYRRVERNVKKKSKMEPVFYLPREEFISVELKILSLLQIK
jgi:hypothetical protein